jgi:hypothetical protein
MLDKNNPMKSGRSAKMTEIWVKKHNLLIFIYILISLVLFLFVAEPLLQKYGSAESLDELFNMAREDNTKLQFYADSATYITLSKQFDFKDILEVILLNENAVGPFIILKFFNSNAILIYIFNVAIFLYSIFVLIKYYPVKKTCFIAILCISPILFTSLLSINKEIVSIFSMANFLAYYKSGKPRYAVISFLFSALVRWQFILIVTFLIFLFSKLNKIMNNRYLVIITLLISISIIYPLLTGSIFKHVNEVLMSSEIDPKGSGLFFYWVKMQNNYLYFLIFVPKLLHILFGTMFRFSLTEIINKVDFYNSFIITTQSIISFCLFIFVITKKKLNLNNDLFYISLIYCIVFAISPIYGPRYFIPLHLLFAIMLAIPNYAKSTTKFERQSDAYIGKRLRFHNRYF